MRLERISIGGVLRFTDPITVDLASLPAGLVAVVGDNGCLSGETLVDVPRDLRVHPHGIPIRDLVGTTPLVYSFSSEEQRLVLARARDVRKTGEGRAVYRVRFDAGNHRGRFLPPRELVGTADHPVMLRDGSFKPLGQLQPHDRLMPLYRRCRDGKYVWINRNDGTFALEHRMVAAASLGRELRADEHGHHRDKNTFNNAEPNIEALHFHDHGALHGSEHPPTYDAHPRGMAGKRHSEDAKRRMADASRRTNAERADVLDRRMAGLRRAHAAVTPQPYHDRERLIDLYVQQGKSTVQIGEVFGVSERQINYWMQKHGIPRRNMSQAQLARSANHVVIGVEFAGYEDVYDLEVPGLHNFVANGVVVHNSGKTTLVEAPIAALFRSFPSRADKPLVDYATTREAFLEAVFTVDAGSYRARVNLDGQRRAADAVLVHTAADGTVTMLNDGKLSTYDEAIARVFPPRDLLLASAVAAQNRAGSFVALDKRGRKELFGRLLGLDRFEAMSVTAKAATARCEAAIGTLGVTQRLLAPEAADGVRQTIEGEAQRALAGAASTAAERAQVEGDRSRLQADRDRLRDDASAHETAKTRLASLSSETAALLVRCQGLRRQQDTARAAAESEDHLLVANLQRQLTELDGRIAKNRALLERAAVVRAAAAELRAARETLATREAEQLVLAAEPQRLLTEGAEAKAALQRVQTAATQLEQARRAAGRLAGVCDVCAFVADARQAQASIPALEAAVATTAACEARVEALRAQYREAEGRRLALVTLVDDARSRIAALEPDAQLLPRLEEAEDRIADLQRDRAVVIDQAEALRRGVAARLTTTVADLEAQYREAQATIDGHAAEVAAAQAEADRTATAAEGVADADRRLAYLDQQWQTLTADQARLQAQVEACESRLAAWRVKAAQLADVVRQMTEISAEWRDWQLLARALGRDGLPVLEIDAAGPTVSAYTNDLLAVCFGPRFTVELITQAAKADGKGTKEVFELRVLDNLRGGDPRDLADLSGGEQILVDEALKNALSLFINARTVGAVRTCWRDETTSPLDPENTVRYIEMLRRVQALGGFHQIIYVSHSAAAQALADVQLRLADGQVTVHLPPFSEAA